MIRNLVLFVSLLFAFSLYAHRLDVKILSTMQVSMATVTSAKGAYKLWLDGRLQPDSLAEKVFQLVVINDSIEVRIPGDTLGRFVQFKLEPLSDTSIFKIKPLKPLSGTRGYDGQLTIAIRSGYLYSRNYVDLEEYVAGVVESECGGQGGVEFFKVQSILCRTYALAQMGRHDMDGFDLCDGVHCQAYRSRTAIAGIHDAALATAGKVLVDQHLSLITAAFHSNCGGQTANSNDVWAKGLPYLRSLPDSACARMPHSSWERRISKEDWLNMLSQRYKLPIEDTMACYKACHIQQKTRGTAFVYGNCRIPYKSIRSDWQLRSAFFSVSDLGDSVLVHGRGYGHGVGLCQEGAIKMSRLGQDYLSIITYYYPNVEVVSMSKLSFFKDEE
jgi:stage II sporulation protein D